jgi:hypothetical protein
MRLIRTTRGVAGLIGVAVAATAALIITSTSANAAPPLSQGPAQDTFGAALVYGFAFPNASPQGANDPACRSTSHPTPVVLVHGTFENQYDNWAMMSPQLIKAGYCVWSFNYGSPDQGVIRGTNHVAQSAGELATFVDKVLATTHASKVDLVGHSQGGMMPRYYIKNLGGSNKVSKLVGLVPSNNGTTLDGLAALAAETGGPLHDLVGGACAACTDQIQNSTFITTLNQGGVDPHVSYTVIATTQDEVVTPYTGSYLPAGPNVTNSSLQDYCPKDGSEHVGISYDPVGIQLVRNALDPAHAVAPTC